MNKRYTLQPPTQEERERLKDLALKDALFILTFGLSKKDFQGFGLTKEEKKEIFKTAKKIAQSK